MKKERRQFDRSFKIMAVELINSGKTSIEVGLDLGIGTDLVSRWRREFIVSESSCFSGNGNPNLTPEQKEILQLKKELRDAELERDILKKAVGIFSKSDGKYSGS
jgi:transposase